MRPVLCLVLVLLPAVLAALPLARVEASRMRTGAIGGQGAREFSGDVALVLDGLRLTAGRLLVYHDGSWEAAGGVTAECDGVRIRAVSARARKGGPPEWSDGRIWFPAVGTSAGFVACRMVQPGRFVVEQAVIRPGSQGVERVVARAALILQPQGVLHEFPGESLFVRRLVFGVVRDLAGRLP